MPVSEARSAAARANGAKSKGPVTAEGKARSAQNSRRHGILSSAFVLRNENPETLRELEEEYLEEWQPVGPTQAGLVAEMALCKYRQARIVAVEVAAWDLQMDKDADGIGKEFAAPPDNAVRSAIAFQNLANETRTLDLTSRYEARFHRQYMRALKELRTLQAERRRGTPGPDASTSLEPAILPNEPRRDSHSIADSNLPNEPTAVAGVVPALAAADRNLPNEPSKSLERNDHSLRETGNQSYYVGLSDLQAA
jgi:hypothetical protein